MATAFPEDAVRQICTHMNDDHRDALASYARFYGGFTGVLDAEMLDFDADGMELAVELEGGAARARIPFASPLQDVSGARATLVAMAQAAANTR